MAYEGDKLIKQRIKEMSEPGRIPGEMSPFVLELYKLVQLIDDRLDKIEHIHRKIIEGTHNKIR